MGIKNDKIKRLKVKFEDEIDKEIWPIKVLLKNFNIQIVNSIEECDVIVGMVGKIGHEKYFNNKKNIIISQENIYFKKNFFSLIESFAHKFAGNKKYKIMDFLNRVIPKSISEFSIYYFLNGYVKIFNDIEKGKIKNIFFISSNSSKSGDIFVLPAFEQLYFHRLKNLLTKESNPKSKFCAFIVSSNSSRERIEFFKKLSRYKKIDSFGRVMNNMGERLFKKSWVKNPDFLKNYKFIICFENSFANEYITEKLPNAMFAGSIPIYRGASNIGKYFNTKSFINFDDCGSYDKMINKIIFLDNNSKEYKKISNVPWFKKNKFPDSIKNKEKDLIEFYSRIFN